MNKYSFIHFLSVSSNFQCTRWVQETEKVFTHAASPSLTFILIYYIFIIKKSKDKKGLAVWLKTFQSRAFDYRFRAGHLNVWVFLGSLACICFVLSLSVERDLHQIVQAVVVHRLTLPGKDNKCGQRARKQTL